MRTYWRNLKDALKDTYFWIWALPCLTLALIGVVAMYWMFGFDHNYRMSHFSGTCRNLSDRESLAMLLTLFLSIGGNLLALGEILMFADKKRKQLKIDYLSLSIVVSVAIIATLTVFVLTNEWCM
jgi:hypothetical protein